MKSTEPAHDTGAPEPDRPTAPRWFQRVVPVTGIVLVLAALAALVFPAFRQQVVLSTSRQPQPYVELYFARTGSGTQAVCTRSGSTARVRFTLTSHLDEPRRLGYRVTVTTSSTKAHPRVEDGAAVVSPGATVEAVRSFAVPRPDRYTVSVRLPGLHQQLRAHCPGPRS